MEENTILVGLDIHEYVKGLCKQFLAPTSDMTEREALAYENGIASTLSLLEQTVHELLEPGENALIVHAPGLEGIVEFLTPEEIITKIFKEEKNE